VKASLEHTALKLCDSMHKARVLSFISDDQTFHQTLAFPLRLCCS
jgi:hypothetical protein